MPRASNTPELHGWRLLGRACREAAGSHGRSSALPHLLERLLEACGAERAFIVRAGDEGCVPDVAAVHSRRDDRTISRTVMLRSLASGRFASADATSDRRLSGGASVRSLALRSVLWAPLPGATEPRRALVLDSRQPPRLPPERLRELIDSFAALVTLALPDERPAERPATALTAPGDSSPWSDTCRWIDRIAPTRLPVLIRGETGSGKERIARALHERSPRRSAPFVALNCAAVTETLLEAELFGTVRGAYTGAERDRPGLFRLADTGTLFLDEVGDMPRSMQAKLLRVLEQHRIRPVGSEHEYAVDVRILTATHRNLDEAIAGDRFRADLFHRLAVLTIDVPPLRRRLADLPSLIAALLPRIREETGLDNMTVTPAALAALSDHDWPGNIRELHAVLARAALRATDGLIAPPHLGLAARSASPPGATMEHRMIEQSLLESAGNLTRAAHSIGWTRQKLHRRMQALGIPKPQ